MRMEQIIKIFENEEFGKVRTVIKDGEPWWILKDICQVLEMKANSAGEVVTFEVDSHDLIPQQCAHIVPDAVLCVYILSRYKVAHVKDDLQIRAAHRVQNVARGCGRVHAVIGHRLDAYGNTERLSGGQNLRQTAAEQLLRLCTGRAGRLLGHGRGLGADAACPQCLAYSQLALEIGNIAKAALVIYSQLDIGAQHGNLNMMSLFDHTVDTAEVNKRTV